MIHNHLENNRAITTKTGLVRSLKTYYNSVRPPQRMFDFIATSYLITANVKDYEYRSFMRRFQEIANGSSNKERLPLKHCQ